MEDQDKIPETEIVAKCLLVIWICIGVAFGIKAAAIAMMVFLVSGLVCMAVNRI